MPRRGRGTSPELLSVAVEDGDLAADEPLRPSKQDSARSFHLATAVDSHHHLDLPSPLGEVLPNLAVAEATAPPSYGRRRWIRRGPLDLHPTVAYRFR